MKRYVRSILLLIVLALLTACGGPTAAQPVVVTPTPLPPAPELERPTYEVRREAIERVLQINGRIVPVESVALAFKRDGRIETINVQRGDRVRAGDVLIELEQEEALDELREAEDALVQAQRDLENAQQAQQKEIEQRRLALEEAQEALERLLPGGEDDQWEAAAEAVEEARRELENTSNAASEAKTSAEYQVTTAGEALEDAQRAWENAYWDWDHVQRYGTDPDQPYIIDENGRRVPNELTDDQKEQFEVSFIQAERGLRDAERNVELAQRAYEIARKDELVQLEQAEEKVREAEEAYQKLQAGEDNQELKSARRAVEEAQLALEEAQEETFNTQIKAVEDAQRRLEKAQQKVEEGRIVSPQDGEVIALAASEGDQVQAFGDPIIEVADPSRLEIAAELSADQMRQLAEGQEVEVSLLTRPDVIMPAFIRRMPAPYGSGGSGAVGELDRTTRFEVIDTLGQELEAGKPARIRIVLERKEDVLVLPLDAIRSFEGRRFVIVREGDRERRVPVEIGIQTEELVEVVEGVEEGDVVVGQ